MPSARVGTADLSPPHAYRLAFDCTARTEASVRNLSVSQDRTCCSPHMPEVSRCAAGGLRVAAGILHVPVAFPTRCSGLSPLLHPNMNTDTTLRCQLHSNAGDSPLRMSPACRLAFDAGTSFSAPLRSFSSWRWARGDISRARCACAPPSLPSVSSVLCVPRLTISSAGFSLACSVGGHEGSVKQPPAVPLSPPRRTIATRQGIAHPTLFRVYHLYVAFLR